MRTQTDPIHEDILSNFLATSRFRQMLLKSGLKVKRSIMFGRQHGPGYFSIFKVTDRSLLGEDASNAKGSRERGYQRSCRCHGHGHAVFKEAAGPANNKVLAYLDLFVHYRSNVRLPGCLAFEKLRPHKIVGTTGIKEQGRRWQFECKAEVMGSPLRMDQATGKIRLKGSDPVVDIAAQLRTAFRPVLPLRTTPHKTSNSTQLRTRFRSSLCRSMPQSP